MSHVVMCCADCEYWMENDDTCRRFPPIFQMRRVRNQNGDMRDWESFVGFPPVRPADFCGEHSALRSTR